MSEINVTENEIANLLQKADPEKLPLIKDFIENFIKLDMKTSLKFIDGFNSDCRRYLRDQEAKAANQKVLDDLWLSLKGKELTLHFEGDGSNESRFVYVNKDIRLDNLNGRLISTLINGNKVEGKIIVRTCTQQHRAHNDRWETDIETVVIGVDDPIYEYIELHLADQTKFFFI
jgi:hypothetical protein